MVLNVTQYDLYFIWTWFDWVIRNDNKKRDGLALTFRHALRSRRHYQVSLKWAFQSYYRMFTMGIPLENRDSYMNVTIPASSKCFLFSWNYDISRLYKIYPKSPFNNARFLIVIVVSTLSLQERVESQWCCRTCFWKHLYLLNSKLATVSICLHCKHECGKIRFNFCTCLLVMRPLGPLDFVLSL